MSEDADAQRYPYPALEGCERGRERAAYHGVEDDSACDAMAQRHRMASFGDGHGQDGDTAQLEPELGLASEGSDSCHDNPASPGSAHKDREHQCSSLHEDVEMGGSGSSGSGTESHGNESHGNDSHGNESVGKDSAMLESSGSNKSSNSHSTSPPSSSNAFSLESSEQDHPSSSGCSSEESAKAKTQKELFKTIKELKKHLPSEKRSKGKTSTLNTLKYALRCVKQVKANEEYYQMLMVNNSQPTCLDVSSYTIEEIDSITSEYTLKNTDIFAVAVSLITGKIVYISDQAASILNCKSEVFTNAKFVEFLAPQDVSVFYSFTTPYRLPSWSMCTGTESSPTECIQEKSFFCRISGGNEREGDLQYYPFRMTPYLMKVQDCELAEEQFCCLLLAERVHSGYEAPRIPPDKRIFTTTHTPNCVFQDVDERAVPLLGYLPQDLIGTPILLNLHPSDRPLMLAIHRKILQYVGQPFDHSSIRFCARNGEYVTIDTSWSSFVNPWSRKVSFVIGRHTVRMGSVNEDVFSLPAFTKGKIMDSDIQEITEQIHRLLLQPVHNIGSSGYGSHGSNGSHEQHLSVGSSSDSNGNGKGNAKGNVAEETDKAKPRTFQEICKGIHMLKTQEQVYPPPPSPSWAKPDQRKTTDAGVQRSLVTRVKDSVPPLLVKEGTAASIEDLTCKDQTIHSYQQISCLDNVIRYLDSCNIPVSAKRKYKFSSNTTSSNSDEDRKGSDNDMQSPQDSLLLDAPPGLSSMKGPKKLSSGGPLTPLTLPSKAESVVSITSQCSYSSTIVHVGDKKTQPESEIMEDVAESPAPLALSPAPPAPPISIPSPPTQEKEAYKRLGLTKQVLAAHTQKEEQAFLSRCRQLCHARTFQKHSTSSPHQARGGPHFEGASAVRDPLKPGGTVRHEATTKKGSRNRKSKKPRMKRPDSSDSAASNRKPRPPLQGLNQTSWSPSEASQSAFSVPYPTIVPGFPLSVYPTGPTASAQPSCSDPSFSTGFPEGHSSQGPPSATPYPAPIVTPVVALVLPNYLFPQMGQIGTAPTPPFFLNQPACQTQSVYTKQQPFQASQTAYTSQQPFQAPQAAYTSQQSFLPHTAYTTQQPFQDPQTAYSTQQSFPVQTQFVPQVYPYGLAPESPKASTMEPMEAAVSRSSTPASGGPEPAASPPLFESRCSSPLQLNLLSMEDTQKSMERQDSTAPSSGAPGNITATVETAEGAGEGSSTVVTEDLQQAEVPGDDAHSDAHSSSSDLLDILLQEDSHSGTGSATSGSTGSRSGSNGCETLLWASGSRTGSSNTSKYFGSVDSLETYPKTKEWSEVARGQGLMEGAGHYEYVLQEPLCLTGSNETMTYQMPLRDIQKVLREDKERLRQMQKGQPRFTSDQRRELVEEHPWMRRGGLPKAINVKDCVYCEDDSDSPLEKNLHGMETGVSGRRDHPQRRARRVPL